MPPRQKPSARRAPKLKLLLDEGFPYRNSFKALNNYFNVRHIKQDFGLEGVPDEEVYKLASEEERLLITFNVRDFRPLIKQRRPTVIGISPVLTNKQIDIKLTAILRKLKPEDLKGKFFKIN